MPLRKTTTNNNDYAPEDILTASAVELKKLEANSQSSLERMYSALSSPFKISNKPCEVPRAAVMRCFEEIMGKANNGNDKNSNDLPEAFIDGGGGSSSSSIGGDNSQKNLTNSVDGAVSLSSNPGFPLVHRCYDVVLQYESCVLDKTLAQHHKLLTEFEARRAEQMELSKEASAAAMGSA